MATPEKESVPLERPRTRVAERLRTARDSLPGRRNDLPPGALGGLPTEPQGDENRDPPPNAPDIPP